MSAKERERQGRGRGGEAERPAAKACAKQIQGRGRGEQGEKDAAKGSTRAEGNRTGAGTRNVADNGGVEEVGRDGLRVMWSAAMYFRGPSTW